MTNIAALVYAAIVSLWLQEGPLPPWAMQALPLAIDVAEAAHARPLPGPEGELRMAAILTALLFHESRANPEAVGDKGQSLGAWQISRHWPAHDATQAAILVHESFRVCASRPLAERLGWYASGGPTCGRPASSRIRMALAGRLLRLWQAPRAGKLQGVLSAR